MTEITGDTPVEFTPAFDPWGPPQPSLSEEQLDILMRPLSASRVKTRQQGGATLSYVEAYDIKATLIRLFGFGGFSADVIDSRIVQVREHPVTPTHINKDGSAKTPQVIAQATVRLHIPSLGCTYTETAIGSNSAWDIGDACDNAIKSAESDALKRAATYLGTQFGLGLYNDGSRAEVVRHLFAPGQAEMWERIRANRPDPNAQAQEQLQHALGASDQ